MLPLFLFSVKKLETSILYRLADVRIFRFIISMIVPNELKSIPPSHLSHLLPESSSSHSIRVFLIFAKYSTIVSKVIFVSLSSEEPFRRVRRRFLNRLLSVRKFGIWDNFFSSDRRYLYNSRFLSNNRIFSFKRTRIDCALFTSISFLNCSNISVLCISSVFRNPCVTSKSKIEIINAVLDLNGSPHNGFQSLYCSILTIYIILRKRRPTQTV